MIGRVLVGIAAALAVFLSACNTIEGAGKDLERGGQVIRDTAKDVQKRF